MYILWWSDLRLLDDRLPGMLWGIADLGIWVVICSCWWRTPYCAFNCNREVGLYYVLDRLNLESFKHAFWSAEVSCDLEVPGRRSTFEMEILMSSLEQRFRTGSLVLVFSDRLLCTLNLCYNSILLDALSYLTLKSFKWNELSARKGEIRQSILAESGLRYPQFWHSPKSLSSDPETCDYLSSRIVSPYLWPAILRHRFRTWRLKRKSGWDLTG